LHGYTHESAKLLQAQQSAFGSIFGESVIITLSPRVMTEVVGNELLLLDTETQSIYSISLDDVVEHSNDFERLTVTAEKAEWALELCHLGVASAEGSSLSRRTLVGTGSALIGSSVLALALPGAAAAASVVPGGSASLVLSFAVQLVGQERFIVRVSPGNFAGATNVALTHTLPTNYLVANPTNPDISFVSGANRTEFAYPSTLANAPAAGTSFTLDFSWTFGGENFALNGTFVWPTFNP
jgi:hypothetical protein